MNSIDYLLKPIHEDRLMRTIHRFEGLTKNYIHDFNQESRMLEILQQLAAAQDTSVSTQKKYVPVSLFPVVRNFSLYR